jgi:hypothetical protein
VGPYPAEGKDDADLINAGKVQKYDNIVNNNNIAWRFIFFIITIIWYNSWWSFRFDDAWCYVSELDL